MAHIRLFCSRKNIEDGVFTVFGDEAYHALRVMRLKAGDSLNIFTEQGSEFVCTVIKAGKQNFTARIEEKLTDEVESPLTVHLIQSMPKAAKLEQIIVHGTELGLSHLYPVQTRYSEAKAERRERWRKIALEAAKQSRRRAIPFIHHAAPLEKLDLKQFEGALRLVAAEPPHAGSLAGELEGWRGTDIVLAVGPEGGFAPEEFDFLFDQGFKPFSMGPRVLRTQTASLAAMAVIQCLAGDWNALQGDQQ